MTVRDILLCLLITLLWGFNYVVVKVVVHDFAPMTTMTVRYALVVVCLLPFALRIPLKLYWPLFKVGMFFGFIYFSLFFWAANHVSASLAAIILQLQVPFSLIFSMFFLKEPPSLLGILGTILAVIGVIYAIGTIEWQGSLLAISALFIAAASWGYGNVLVRRMKLSVDPLTLNAAIAIFSLPLLLILTFVMEPHALARIQHATFIDWVAMAYMVLISTIFCYSAWFKQIGHYGINMVIPFILLVPIVAIISSKLFLFEPITLHLIIGTALTVAGVGLVVLPKSILSFLKKSKA